MHAQRKKDQSAKTPDLTLLRPSLDALTAMRGLAAIWVLSHNDFVFRETLGIDAVTGILSKGYLAVDFFLVLSGFILTYVHQHEFRTLTRTVFARFIGLRLARIYPLYLLLLLVRIWIEGVKWLVGIDESFLGPAPFTEGNSWSALTANIFLIQAWGFYDEPTWVPTFWTISAEWFAYLTFPVLICWLGKFGAIRMGGLLTGCMCLTVLTIGDFQFGKIEFPMQYSLLRCLPEFVLGLILGLHFCSTRADHGLPQQNPRLTIYCTRALLLLAVLWVHWEFFDLGFLVLILLAIWLVALQDQDSERGILHAKPLVYLGTISYAIYLSHMIVQSAWRVLEHKLLGPPTMTMIPFSFTGKLVLILIASGVLYYYVEVPARSVLRGWVQRKFPA